MIRHQGFVAVSEVVIDNEGATRLVKLAQGKAKHFPTILLGALLDERPNVILE
jgi:hypothetical protein